MLESHRQLCCRQWYRILECTFLSHKQSDWGQDTNRELALRDMQVIISCLQSAELRLTTLAVLFNLCNDFGEQDWNLLRTRSSCRQILPKPQRLH